MAERVHSVVVGSGFGGCCSLAHAQKAAGHADKRLEDVGGRACVFERGGFRHDADQLSSLPYFVDELFALFGETRSEHLEFLPLIHGTGFISSGSEFNYRPSLADTHETPGFARG